MDNHSLFRKFVNDVGKRHRPGRGALEILKYIGPGFLVTIGFIDPGNWSTNMAAGAQFGYALLWTVTLSTVMLIFLQHNAAHLGIATGLCLSEAATIHLKPWASRSILTTAMLASVATSFAEIFGTAIGLNLLFHIPIPVGALLTSAMVCVLLFTNSYRKIEKWIIGFVSLIGLSYVLELAMVKVDWPAALTGLFVPAIPKGSIYFIMGIMGAVVMPHNLFLHSEVIQSRRWDLQDRSVIEKQLKYEFTDTLVSMIAGWAINCAMIVLAASVFWKNHVAVTDIVQARNTLQPLAGDLSSLVFGIALVFAGISSSVTSGMAGGSIFSGIFREPFNIKDSHTRIGVGLTLILPVFLVFFSKDPYQAMVLSQVLLGVQLPVTIFTQIRLTSSAKVMKAFRNNRTETALLLLIGFFITGLNIALFFSYLPQK
jgi:manganese transport protein